MITAERSRELYEYLAFRHFFVHGYTLTLRETDLVLLAREARGAWNRFLREAERALPS